MHGRSNKGYWPLWVPLSISVFTLVGIPVALALFQPVLSGGASDAFDFLLITNAEKAFVHGVSYAVVTVALQLVVGVGAALALWLGKRGTNALATLFMLPYFVPTISVVLILTLFFDPRSGFFTMLGMSIDTSVLFTSNGIFALVVIASVWQFFPFIFLAVYSKLRTIPSSQVEAITLDGAGLWHIFKYVAWPHLIYVIQAVLILRLLWMFTKFDTVYLIAGNSLLRDQVETVPVLAYRLAFQQGMLTASTLLCIAMFVLLIAVPFIVSKATQEVSR